MALNELTSLTGVPLSSPLQGTEKVPERLKLDEIKLKGYLDSLGMNGRGMLKIFYI